MRLTRIAGIIIRSASVRNAFELYAPFLEICKGLAGDNARLILSSEWEYVPFTYPQSLEDLPNFIVIGLPASESDNVLIFPAAGHELGHTVWSKNALGETFKSRIETAVSDILTNNRSDLETIFPEVKGTDFEQDLFVQSIKSSVFSSAIQQAEEMFCDFLGLLLFGESYLHAFEYLVAPQVGGGRAKEYPDTHERAATLEKFATERLQINCVEYSKSFLPDTLFRFPHDNFICLMADKVLLTLHDELFAKAGDVMSAANISTPTNENMHAALTSFRLGAPYDNAAALGDLINAGWSIFHDEQLHPKGQASRSVVDYISDLVLKSAEIHEIRSILK